MDFVQLQRIVKEADVSASMVYVTGAILAATFACHSLLNCHWRQHHPPTCRLRVVITGGSRGLGRALATQFLVAGDSVLICGRDAQQLDAAAVSLRRDTGSEHVITCVCDVSDGRQVDALVAAAGDALGGGIDLWINNAGRSQALKAPLADTPQDIIASVVNTNLIGTLLGCRAAIGVMKRQACGGSVWMIDGAGSAGMATPTYAAYGCTKAALPQLHKSLVKECKGTGVGVHVASPGMVITDLLLGHEVPTAGDHGDPAAPVRAPHIDRHTARVFNILAERPETAASWLVPRMRNLTISGMARVGAARRCSLELRAACGDASGPAGGGVDQTQPLVPVTLRGHYIQYLTPFSAAGRFIFYGLLAPWQRKDRLLIEL